MAAPSYTYTLANSTTADADEVMQNFNDILNGVSDGSKDLSISALTVAGAANFNGAVTLGNASGDDLTANGRWAADMDPKTAATYALGSASHSWSELHIDKGATDGGAVYFGGTSTDFLKSSVDGSTLNVGGFVKVDGTNLEYKGKVNGTAATTGYIGEYQSAACTASVTPSSNNVYTDITGCSLSLTAGIWLIGYNASVKIENSGAGASEVTTAGCHIYNSTDTSAVSDSESSMMMGIGLSTGLVINTVSSVATVNISGTKTFLLRGRRALAATGTNSVTFYDTVITGGFTDPDTQTVLWATRIA